MDVSRNPRDYHPTVHAIDRAKSRGIEFNTIAEIIRDGELINGRGENAETRYFLKEFPNMGVSIGVVVNPDTGDVVTVRYGNGEDAPRSDP